MKPARYDFGTFFPSINKIFDDFVNKEFGSWMHNNFSATNTTLPSVNIKENNDEFVVEMAAPGMEKTDFKINLNNNLLTISSEKQEEKNEEKDEFVHKEFSYRAFQRSFTLPDIVHSDNITAKYENGVLSVHIPKKEEAKKQQPKQIEIA
ncbi:Hsp20/alpha crystallin family protein [Rhodoflexus sp.]